MDINIRERSGSIWSIIKIKHHYEETWAVLKTSELNILTPTFTNTRLKRKSGLNLLLS